MAEDIYAAMAAHLPNEVGVSGALITMVEPDVGHEHTYNRWYEDDHFYSGAMVGPWIFSGRRWVATRDLQLLRFPDESPIAQPVTAGCYISTYLWAAGHYADADRWSVVAMADNLYPQGRGFDQRQHVYTAFSTHDFAVINADEPYLLAHHVLDRPFPGMVVEVVEPADGADRDAVIVKLRDEILPAALSDASAAAVLAFTPWPQTSGKVPRVGSAAGAGRNITLLWFLRSDPRACWAQYRTHTERIASANAKLVFAAPFIPTIPGTDTYVAELR
ncbi:MAG: hypothetical protein AB7V43_09715 [Acidimicrobiia bacterium]